MKPEHITAWALEEASAEERQQLEAALRDNPKAKQAAEDTKEFCHFLLAELRDESLALTDTQRERLKAQPLNVESGPDRLKPEQRTHWRFGVVVKVALAACVALGGFWTWSVFESRQPEKNVADVMVEDEVHQIQLERRSEMTVREKSEAEVRLLAELPVKAGVVMEMERVAGSPLARAPEPKPVGEPTSRLLAVGEGLGTMTAGDVAELKKIQDQTTYGLHFGDKLAMPVESQSSVPLPGMLASNSTVSASGTVSYVLAGQSNPTSPASGPVSAARPALESFVTIGGISNSGGMTKAGEGTLTLEKSGGVTLRSGSTYTGGTTVSADSLTITEAARLTASPAPTPMSVGAGTTTFNIATSASPTPAPLNTTNAGANTRFRAINGVTTTTSPAVTSLSTVTGVMPLRDDRLADVGGRITSYALVLDPQAATPPGVMNPQQDRRYFESSATSDAERREKTVSRDQLQREKAANETYTRIIENELKEVAREPLSTLSIDVDTASYANVRRFLNQNTAPPPDAVRIEELVNYFPTAEEGPNAEAKEPFGVRVELAPCPWQPAHRLARIAIKGRELGNERKASNLVFLVDVSGSMDEPAKLPLVQQSLRMLTEQLGEGDRVTMVVYAGSSGLVLPPTNGEQKPEILAAIDKLKAGGSTHGSAGIQLAYEQAVGNFIKGGVNRVILCTDGDFNVGVSSPEELEKLITKKAKSGVFLSVLGFGTGNLKDRTMETLADKGNGNYAYIDSLSEARKVLVEQMSGTLVTIAKDVKIQVEFNPAAVRSYRLIGYENRLLAKEDFNDDAKDAGEIGAGHSVVALYEVVPANLPPGAESRPVVDGLKYQTPAVAPAQLADVAKSGEVMTVKLRYKEPEGTTSRLLEVPVKDEGKTLTASTEEFKFSAAVAGFGLLLRDSGYQGTLSWETVRKLALDGKGADRLGYRGEFLQLIDKARGLKEARP